MRGIVVDIDGVMKFDDGKTKFATDLEERMSLRDQGKFLEEICLFFFSYDIND